MTAEAVSLSKMLGTFSEFWSPKIVSRLNGHDAMVVKECPVCQLKIRYTFEFPNVVADESEITSFCLPGDQHIVGSNWAPRFL